MKTLDQIYRYTKDCRFDDDDWQRVLDYCRTNFKGGKIHKSTKPLSRSTYEQFIDWIDNGYGSGDMVRYGKTMGLVGDSTPECTYLMAYCDYEGNLIAKKMVVVDVHRLKLLNDDECLQFKKLMVQNSIDYDVRLGMTCELHVPKEYEYIILNSQKDSYDIGMYLESEGYNFHLLSYLCGNTFKTDCWINCECAPVRPAKEDDIRKLQKAALSNGFAFNERAKQYIKLTKKKHNNIYWYMNERFQILSDVDNGSKKHTERYDAGNYFFDQESAILFMKNVSELAKSINGHS